MKPTPMLSTHCATCSGVRLTFTPSFSSTSALPQVLETERPPCLATCAPAAAAAGVDQVPGAFHADLGGQFAHHRRRSGDLGHGLALGTQRDQHCGNLRRGELPAHDVLHQLAHLGERQVVAVDQTGQCLRIVHYFAPSRKFFSRSCPCSVRMDSGWNCTPCTASVLWRTPMISPSSVQAVLSRQSGGVSRSITSEW